MTAPQTTADAAAQPAADERFAVLDKALRRVRFSQDQLIEMLHVAQDVFGYLPTDVLWHLARELRLPPSTVYGVATFYHLFSFAAPGDHTCTVCTGTACFVKGADQIVRAVQETYGIAPGDTTPDDRLTLTTARCLGSCGLAPVVVFDGTPAGHQSVDATLGRIGEAVGVASGDGDRPTDDAAPDDAAPAIAATTDHAAGGHEREAGR